MNLQSGTYYWPTTMPDAPSYPSLEENLNCDILIIGGGGSAAQCAYYLAEKGLEIAVIEKGKLGSGSTSANTALIQYSGEKMFMDLINTFGKEYIARHLQLLSEAIDDIETASKTVEMETEFTRRDSLYLASCKEDVSRLEKEYELLKEQGFELDLLTKNEIEMKYPFSREAAIYSFGDAELNPFKFTHALFDFAAKRKVRIFENTEMNGHHYNKQEKRMVITTKNGYTIKAAKVIFATGYEGTEQKKEKKVSFVSTYTITTNKVSDFSSWYNRTLIWETARPYLYMRTTADNRIIIGGLDENTTSAEERDSMLMHKKDKLADELKNMFPDLDVKPEYYLAGFYGGTKDGLPIIGIYDEFPESYFLFGFGDNGTVYSQLLAKIISTEILEGDSPNLELYLQGRPLLGRK